MTTPKNQSCPREKCRGPLVTTEYDGESPVEIGLLRCAGCGMYSNATDEMREQAAIADAAWEASNAADPVPPVDTLTLTLPGIIASIEAVVEFKV